MVTVRANRETIQVTTGMPLTAPYNKSTQCEILNLLTEDSSTAVGIILFESALTDYKLRIHKHSK